MTTQARIELLAELGRYLKSGGDEELDQAIRQSYAENQWFTEEHQHFALHSIADEMLDSDKLHHWITQYTIPNTDYPTQTIGLVMAGNIPLVGFQDWLCVFAAGMRARVKLSDKDKRLLPLFVKKMGAWQPESWAYTEFLAENEALKGFDAVIATGSNNTARYFEQYFGAYRHVIRRNRNGVAVLTGAETPEELKAFGLDVFMFFGLGCRNISKLYVPQGYDFEPLLEALHNYREIVHHNKYKNNFDYNFTLYIMNNIPFKNNGCLILKEDPLLQSRIASVHYEFYENLESLSLTLQAQIDDLQCIVSSGPIPGVQTMPFGESQKPGLNDYPDGVDIMRFLLQAHTPPQ